MTVQMPDSKGSIYGPFMELLRAGLWNRLPDISFFPLPTTLWNEILIAAKKQTVTAIVYDGILLLPDELHPPVDIIILWTAEVERIERRNHQMNRCLISQYQMCKKNGIGLILLKGQGIATFYDKPEHRGCGDIDLCLSAKTDFLKCKSMLINQGVCVTMQTRDSLYYIAQGFIVELHNSFIDIHNPFKQTFIDKLQEREHSRSMFLLIRGEKIPIPSVLLSHVQINMHILKHMLSFGIGLRQMCDSARLYYTLSKKTDGAELIHIYRELGVLRWMLTLHELLVTELGLSEAYLPFPRNKKYSCKWMLEEVWACGNFGFHDLRYGKHNLSANQRTNVLKHWFRRFRQQLRLAPQETICFPFVQLYSRIFVK